MTRERKRKPQVVEADLLTPEEVAAALGLCRRRVVARELRAALPWLFLGRRTMRCPRAAVEAYRLEQLARSLPRAEEVGA